MFLPAPAFTLSNSSWAITILKFGQVEDLSGLQKTPEFKRSPWYANVLTATTELIELGSGGKEQRSSLEIKGRKRKKKSALWSHSAAEHVWTSATPSKTMCCSTIPWSRGTTFLLRGQSLGIQQGWNCPEVLPSTQEMPSLLVNFYQTHSHNFLQDAANFVFLLQCKLHTDGSLNRISSPQKTLILSQIFLDHLLWNTNTVIKVSVSGELGLHLLISRDPAKSYYCFPLSFQNRADWRTKGTSRWIKALC